MYHHVLSNQETERNINRKHPETRVPLTQFPTMPFIIEKVLSAPTFKDERQTHYSGVLFSPKFSQRCALSISAAGPLNLILHSPHPHTVMTAASRPVLWLVHTSVVHSSLRSWCDHLPHQISQFPHGIWTVSYVLQGLLLLSPYFSSSTAFTTLSSRHAGIGLVPHSTPTHPLCFLPSPPTLPQKPANSLNGLRIFSPRKSVWIKTQSR